MIILRYFALLQTYHLLTFYKQSPWTFLLGTVLAPYFVVSRLSHPPKQHPEMVLNGIDALRKYWEVPGATLPPEFVRRRLLKMQQELDDDLKSN